MSEALLDLLAGERRLIRSSMIGAPEHDPAVVSVMDEWGPEAADPHSVAFKGWRVNLNGKASRVVSAETNPV